VRSSSLGAPNPTCLLAYGSVRVPCFRDEESGSDRDSDGTDRRDEESDHGDDRRDLAAHEHRESAAKQFGVSSRFRARSSTLANRFEIERMRIDVPFINSAGATMKLRSWNAFCACRTIVP
jgi:hypothetical protein